MASVTTSADSVLMNSATISYSVSASLPDTEVYTYSKYTYRGLTYSWTFSPGGSTASNASGTKTITGLTAGAATTITGKVKVTCTCKYYSRTKNGDSYNWNRGKEVEVNELTNEDIKSATAVFGKHGNYLEVKLKDGTTLNVPASSYTPNYSNMMAGNAGTIEGYRAMLADGKTHYQLPTGEVLPIESLINSELNAMGDNFMSSLGLSQVNPTKVDRGEYTIQVY